MSDTKWSKPATLRAMSYAGQVECQNVLSGRWRPLSDPYWDDCAIEVPWRFADHARQQEERQPGPCSLCGAPTTRPDQMDVCDDCYGADHVRQQGPT